MMVSQVGSCPRSSSSLPLTPWEASEEEFRDMAKHVEQALADHGVRVEVTDIKAGPRVVQFGLSPGWVPKRGSDDSGERSRVKVQSIITREKDLALAPYDSLSASRGASAWSSSGGTGGACAHNPPKSISGPCWRPPNSAR